MNVNERLKNLTEKACKECYHYNDCPLNYLCPAAEVLRTIIEMQEDGELKILVHKNVLEREE